MYSEIQLGMCKKTMGGFTVDWKVMGKWALAALVTMYAIRYLRASNSFVASLYPQPSVTPSAGATVS